MGRQFRALRVADVVHQHLSSKINSNHRPVAPPWLKAVEKIPPAEVLTRTVPVALQPPNPRLRKPRRTYRPQNITYEEDELRQTFFKDHPWELARPRVVLETDGKDAQRYDWSKGLYQDGLALCGECVVQRQMWLMNSGMTKEQAYDVARREFYALRHREEVERRVAMEEARMMGGYFKGSLLVDNMRQEDRVFESWKSWAKRMTAKAEATRGQAYTSFGEETPFGSAPTESADSAPI
ncbi:37S ribosomal protein rsm25 [Sporothrix brasiliensis 5110]|uniref:Small ribosomal subunit protein mS23 n=1 Tax=Sporothrix brasiliensis 5110 TaxID=1398154 RepID=A0A0C2EW28_9PEZI|nr:37S ribosomal protein rsm25 [Sporothrix brasiliensis 5110]KIH90774.1 37S ribosomal protein rsm25 [Sporothrix brasiliensis 5110]